MRILWLALAWLALCNSAHAAPVQFAIDLAFPPLSQNIGIANFVVLGPQPGAGLVRFDDSLLDAGGADSFVAFSQLQDFQIAVPVTKREAIVRPDGSVLIVPGAVTFERAGLASFLPPFTGHAITSDCSGFAPAPDCGLLFTGRMFSGFQGSVISSPTGPNDFQVVLFGQSTQLFATWNSSSLGDSTVRLREVAPVPEPSTWAILGLGALAIAWTRRRHSDPD
jgi:hypothetical protein